MKILEKNKKILEKNKKILEKMKIWKKNENLIKYCVSIFRKKMQI